MWFSSDLLWCGLADWKFLVIEVLLTAAYVFTVFMLATQTHKASVCQPCGTRHRCANSTADRSLSQYISPVGIGLALFIAQLIGRPFTGASLNPARSFGAAVAAHHFPGYHWIYWLGPALGSLLAVGFYKVVKILEVEVAVVVHGDDLPHHRRGVSNTSNQQVDEVPNEVHVLDPVAENDLEKGLKAPGAGGAAAVPTGHPSK